MVYPMNKSPAVCWFSMHVYIFLKEPSPPGACVKREPRAWLHLQLTGYLRQEFQKIKERLKKEDKSKTGTRYRK